MKKLLLASTAVVAFAGAAAAEVAISGSGRMGIVNDGDDSTFSSRVRVAFALSAESDSGLSFGGSIRADNAAGGNAGTAGSVFMSGAFGTLSMGNVAGAAEAAVGDLAGVGYAGVGDKNETTFLTGDGAEASDKLKSDDRKEILQYSFSTSGFSFFASASDGKVQDNYAVGVSYAFGDYNVGIGYESTDDFLNQNKVETGSQPARDATHVVASASGAFGPVVLKAVYGMADVDGATATAASTDFTQYGVSAVYTFDAVAVTGFYRNTDDETGTTAVSTDYVGLGVSYDLGGGAAVKAGVVNINDDKPAATSGDDTEYDLGVTFSF